MQKSRAVCAILTLIVTIVLVFVFWNNIYGIFVEGKKKQQKAVSDFENNSSIETVGVDLVETPVQSTQFNPVLMAAGILAMVVLTAYVLKHKMTQLRVYLTRTNKEEKFVKINTRYHIEV